MHIRIITCYLMALYYKNNRILLWYICNVCGWPHFTTQRHMKCLRRMQEAFAYFCSHIYIKYVLGLCVSLPSFHFFLSLSLLLLKCSWLHFIDKIPSIAAVKVVSHWLESLSAVWRPIKNCPTGSISFPFPCGAGGENVKLLTALV